METDYYSANGEFILLVYKMPSKLVFIHFIYIHSYLADVFILTSEVQRKQISKSSGQSLK